MPLILKAPIVKSEPKELLPSTSLEKLRSTAVERKKLDVPMEISNNQEAVALRDEIRQLKQVRDELKKANGREREGGVELVVNGERKKVSKTSRYLLDMLTLDDQ